MVRLRGMCPQSIISCAAHDSLKKACREGSSSGIWYGACSEDSRASGSARFRTFGQLPRNVEASAHQRSSRLGILTMA